MLEVIAVLCLLGGCIILFVLSSIDLKRGLLPNELVLGFATLGFVFHLCTLFYFLSMTDMFLGGFIGGGILYLVRMVSNAHYNTDTLGLGDVKLMAAAGVWLGPYYILIAMTIGATAGIAHGLWLAISTWTETKLSIDFNRLSLPAGPGFALGIIITGLMKFWNIPLLFTG